MKVSLIVLIVFSALIVSSCDSGVSSPRGFSLPEGNVESGEQIFVKYQCLSCHTLEGFDPSGIEQSIEKPVSLGGARRQTTTYAELVTSIIHPSHKLARGLLKDITDESGKSKMRIYNDIMTVKELTDLVVFLETKYTIEPYYHTPYAHYPL